MDDKSNDDRSVAIPSGRLSRLGHMGAMTFGVLGNMVVNGATQLGKGQRPMMKDLLLTPKNITRVTDQLSKMRGAAMKIGQLVSMDSGDFLPPELAQIMTRLRNDAHPMPPAQLKQVLNAQLPDGWLKLFKKFDVRPIAAASIGQVHRAQLKDGRDLAMKIQYPGVANSIDSDVANVGVLIRMSGLLPKGFELAPYLEEGRKQLHEETDYAREGAQLVQFQNLLMDAPQFVVPALQADWCTPDILAMDYVTGIAIEDAKNDTQPVRDQIIINLLDLTLRELFEFGLMQTDPNFANYLYKPETQQIVLLDFGAVRTIAPFVGDQYRALIRAGLRDDMDDIMKAAQDIGLFDATTRDAHRVRIAQMIRRAFGSIRNGALLDFNQNDLPQQLQADGLALLEDGFVPPVLPMDVLLIQRKFAGIFLLAARLGARIDLAAMLHHHIRTPDLPTQ
ncbi:ABC1 family protein [Octadecabacter antarcticus 307]|uniref:ABC1 family protein n=1 Tax=Octadecabacter antarcticus 307 TaxID=391626 RepID=M9RHF6_9RHOB|nr:AarF/ABC1/UbiB kinase family protein [Octadecabacter antarcticus]AGI69270.1 ABC1 family protein [Octadecabacter antarcticus 307]